MQLSDVSIRRPVFASVLSLLLIVVGIALGDAVYFEAALLIAVFGFFGTVAAARFLKRGSIVE